VDIDQLEVASAVKDDEMLAIDEALEQLAAHDKTKAELVKLIYFVGLTIPEAASILGISEPTAKRYWSYARAWLLAAIEAGR
jgi:DNA-directed RNA polymerase specialized sigma24 family protein